MNSSFKAVLAALNANNGKAVDSHNNNRDTTVIKAIATLGNVTVALLDAAYYSMNVVIVGADGRPILTSIATAVMYPEYLDGTLEQAVEKFNKVIASSNANETEEKYMRNELTDFTRIESKDTTAMDKVLYALRNTYGWAVNDIRAKQVAVHDHSPIKIEAVASVDGKAVSVSYSGGVNYIRELIVTADGQVHLTANVIERNHSVGEVMSAGYFFRMYNSLPDRQLTFDEVVFLDAAQVAA